VEVDLKQDTVTALIPLPFTEDIHALGIMLKQEFATSSLVQLVKQELLGQFSSTVEQNCIIKKDDFRAKKFVVKI
jgi:hypothetical protein